MTLDRGFIVDQLIRAELARRIGRPVTGRSYMITDHRRTEPVIFPERAQTPSVQGTVAVPATKTTSEIRFDVSCIRMQWKEYLDNHKINNESHKWMETFKELLPKLTDVEGEATILVHSGTQVATYRRDAKLNLSRLAKEQPQIIEQYTRIVAEEKFDEAAFAKEMPALHAMYRGRSLRLTT